MAWVNGKLLGCAFNGGSELWEIDVETGTLASVVGDMGIQRVRGLAYDKESGVLFGIHLPQTWEAIGTLDGSRALYRVSLEGAEHRCAWVRIAKDTNCLHVQRFLVYGHRRS